MAKVSLVIPAYNSEKYIDKALNSVESQTFDDMDIVLVNDGSSDKTLYKMLKYQEESTRMLK